MTDLVIYVADDRCEAVSALLDQGIDAFLLSDYRKARYEKQGTKQGRRESLMASLCLKQALNCFGCQEAEMTYETGPYGKCYFQNRSDLHFSISHSGHLALAAVSTMPIGIDIEGIKEPKLHVAKRFFTKGELQALQQAEDAKTMFYEVWTRKESLIKWAGFGLTLPMDTFTWEQDLAVFGEVAKRMLTENRIPLDPVYTRTIWLSEGYASAYTIAAEQVHVQVHTLTADTL